MTDTTTPTASSLAHAHAVPSVSSSLVWHAVVDVGARESLGASPQGERFIIPILGGEFWGGDGHARLRGVVRPGGADRQLWRPDGVRELHALYEMQTDDGAILTVNNHVLIDDPANGTGRTGKRYARSVVHVTAPQGPHDWLNRRVLVGTLQPLMPQRTAVLIRVFVVD